MTGATSYNQTRMLQNQKAFTVAEFFLSAKFWFATMQTWQAEFFAMALYLILSVWLRQSGSSESKPTDSSDSQTGEANK